MRLIECSVGERAEFPERSAELGILMVKHRNFALKGHGMKVPPAAAIADHHEAGIIDPLRLQHALRDGSREGRHRSGLKVGHPQFGAVPGHLRMLPPDPGEVAAVGREARESEKMRSRGKGSDACLIIRTGTVELHRHDVPRDHAIRVRLAHRNDVRPADADVAESKAAAGRREWHGCRAAVIQPIEPLVAELHEDERAVGRDRPRSSPVFMHAAAGIPRCGQHIALRVAHGIPSTLPRAALQPPHVVANPAASLHRMPTLGDVASRDRREPGSIGSSGGHRSILPAGALDRPLFSVGGLSFSHPHAIHRGLLAAESTLVQ